METDWTNQQIETHTIPALEEIAFQQHPIRYRKYRLVSWSIIWAILTIVFVVVSTQAGLNGAIINGSVLLIFVELGVMSSRIGYKKRSYALRERDLTYKKGWIFYSITTIPFNRIQHTEVSQGPIERKFSLSTLKIYTAGGSTSDLSIPGLEPEEAQALRDFISKKAAINA